MYLKNQQRLDQIQSLSDFISVIEILRLNYIESSNAIYQGLNLHQMIALLHSKLTADNDLKFYDEETKVLLGILYTTKESNPPYHFSWEFIFGTYGPLLVPMFSITVQIAIKEYKRRSN